MLTGRTRYRVAGWFHHRLVLQVQYRCMSYGGMSCAWRDAQVEDLQVLP